MPLRIRGKSSEKGGLMKFSIGLEDPFAFSSYWYAIGLGLILLALGLFMLCPPILDRIEKRSRSSFRKSFYSRTKDKYLKKIGKVEAAFDKGQLNMRGVHQQMSSIVRSFVQTVTGWPTEAMVYLELVNLDRPELAELVRQYYEPEFAYYSEADAKSAIEKGKELITKWS